MPPDDAITFLKMAAIEIRRIVEHEHETWAKVALLSHVANQCARQADELETKRATQRAF